MSRERYLSDSELEALLRVVRERRHVNQPRDHALFALLANTGIRPSEALALERGDVHAHARPAWIWVKRMKKRKAIAERDDIEITDRLAEILSRHVDALPPGSGQRVFSVNRRSVQRLFKVYARRAGLSSRWYLYALRHTAATRMYVVTRDIKTVQAMLGHESPDTSSIYAHIPRSLLIETVNRIPAVV